MISSSELNKVSLGLWVDNKRAALHPDFMSWVGEELHFDLLALMIDPSDKAWNPNWKAKDIEKICKAADEYSIEIILTTWPYPDKDQIDAMSKDMEELLLVGRTSGWETDQEFNWRKSKVNPHHFKPRTETFESEDGVHVTIKRTPYDLAGDYLLEKKGEVCARTGTRNELTTFTSHPENGQFADVAPHCDRLLVQAYSVDERNGRDIRFMSDLGPGGMQHKTLRRTMRIPGVAKSGGPDLGVGHAAWRQRFHTAPKDRLDALRDRGVPGEIRVPFAAMEVAFETALREYPTIDHRWWSSKHIWGPGANSYAAKFLRSLRGGAFPSHK